VRQEVDDAGGVQKLLQKKCPWHPGANHAAIDCYHLRRTFSNSGGGKKDKKPMDKEPEDDDQGDEGCNPKFQDASKTVNVIFGGDGDFGSRQKKKIASLGDHVCRADGTTTTPLVGGAHLVLPR
jgi:hypothetical protein